MWNFQNTYRNLPDVFFTKIPPMPVREPKIVLWNESLAAELGIPEPKAEIFSGNELPPGADPLAQAYAGHQYAHFTMLGDGRAILLGEQVTPSGKHVDVQLKGSGQTPYSRRGDGRAVLGPMLREYIVSEAMHAYGIPTTRSLAVTATGESVYREAPLPGAVLTRIAASHIRVGTFEFAARVGRVRELADYAIQRHFPELRGKPYREFLREVITRQATLIAKWMSVGFIHGVMNTDNMAISGETIDYGPCAFMDEYNPAAVFSSIDQHGRYAYINQAPIAQWNLTRFAEILLPLFDESEETSIAIAKEELARFQSEFEKFEFLEFCKKLGLKSVRNDDASLVADFLKILEAKKLDFTNSFRNLGNDNSLIDLAWQDRWKNRIESENQSLDEARKAIETNNPAVIPRNHKVDAALKAAERGDLSLVTELVGVLKNPYSESSENARYRSLPRAEERVQETFCGT